MEFLELLENIQQNYMSGYESVAQAIEIILPTLYLIISLLTCFIGLKIHHLWTACIFFFFGFFITAIGGGVLFPMIAMNLWIVIGFIVGVLATWYSHKLIKLQIFILNFFMAFSITPNLLEHFMDSFTSLWIGLIISIAVGILAAKYRYIVTIASTSLNGSSHFSQLALTLVGITNKLLILIITALLACAGWFTQWHFHNHKKQEEKLNPNLAE